MAAIPDLAREPGCAAELTEIRAGGQAWWSLGFEATGPASLLRSALQTAAGQMFAQAPPGQVDLGMSCCQSYAQWLGRRGTGADTGSYEVRPRSARDRATPPTAPGAGREREAITRPG